MASKDAIGGNTAVVIEDENNPEELGIAFLEGPAEYLNELFAKGPAKTIYGQEQTTFLGGAATETELDKTTPVNERQLKSIFPHATYTMLRDPLTNIDKTRIHDNIRRDGATKRALLFLAYFMMPEEPVLTIALNRRYATKQREQEQLALIQNDPTYLDILEEIMNCDDNVDIHTREIEMVFSGHAYGRAVQVKQYDAYGYPKRLIPLSSPRLGPVWVDKYTHEFLGVEYKDYPTDKRILLAKDIIHYEVDDFQTTPNSRYFGMSAAEASMSIGERNRAANEIAIPEIMKRMFAPLMLIKSKTKSQAKLNMIRDSYKSGKTVFYNSDMEITVVQLPHDLDKLQMSVEEGSKQIFRDLTVPLGVGWQDDQNRATFEGSVLQWYESVLAFKRTQLNNIMWRQWYKPQLELIFKNRSEAQAVVRGDVLNYLLQNVLNPKAPGLPFKIAMEFKNVKTTGFLDTAAALAQFHDRRLLSDDLVREEAGLGKYNEEMAEEASSTMGTPNNMFTAAMEAENAATTVPNVKNLANQSTSVFSKGLPTANTSEPYKG